MKVYHNPRCSKSRCVIQMLEDKGVSYEIVDYLKEVPSAKELKDIITKLGIKPVDLVRKGEADFKDNFKGKQLSDDDWIQAMIKFPKLIERPIVVKGNKAVIGRPLENILSLL